jgi:hypothetical protein
MPKIEEIKAVAHIIGDGLINLWETLPACAVTAWKASR